MKNPTMAALILLLLAPLGAQTPTVRQGLVKPIWITSLPEQAGRIYAMGIAPVSSTEAQALTAAAGAARGEVLSRLRATVKSDVAITSKATMSQQMGGRATGSSEQQVGQSTRVQASATELPGLAVEETWVDVKDGSAYALAYLDVPVAERELRARFTAQKNDLFQEGESPTDPRERMRMLGRLKLAQIELTKLDDMAALIAAGGGDAGLRSQIRGGKLSVDREMEQLRASLTLSLEGAQGASQITGILRNAALKAGLGWAASGGEFQLVMDYRSDARTAKVDVQHQQSNGWWSGGWVTHTTSQDTGIIVARGVLTLTLRDRAGTEYESVDIEAKGVGVSDFQAENRLKEDFKAKLEKTFSKWLENLVK
jgi:hypothetical protein